MSSSLENVSTSVNIQNFSTTKEIPFDYIQDLSLVIDATTTQISHSQVLNFTTVFHIPNIIIGHGNSNSQTFFTDFDEEYQISVLDYFSMKKIGVV